MIGSKLDPSSLFASKSSNMNDSSSFHSANYDVATKLTSLGNHINNKIMKCLASDNAQSCNVDCRGQNTLECMTTHDASNQNEQRTSSVDLLNGITVGNILQNGDSKKNKAKVETPVERNHHEVTPKLDPPPKVNRNSFRVPDLSSNNGRLTIQNSGLSEADFADDNSRRRDTNRVESQCNWDNFALSENTSYTVVKELAASPRLSCSDGNGNNCGSMELLNVGTVQGSKGIRNCFAIQHQNSVDSTSKLKLSFSDNE